MKRFALTVPFENLDVIHDTTWHLDENSLFRKIVENDRGGMCYELNPLFFYILKGMGFRGQMIAATIDGNDTTMQNTHIASVVFHHDEPYLIDVGFGMNLPLQPLPLTGEWVHSITGNYRVVKTDICGTYRFEKHKNGTLKMSYTFTLAAIDETAMNEARDAVHTSAASPFNKAYLMSKLTDQGHMTLTETSYTTVIDGEKHKKDIDQETFRKLSQQKFSLHFEG
ncbi:arylamine N-acetyltransferase [Bacillaceae bacterium SIJ1]|nr:arylamine N-acetyltransferase [Litoribacterium kuwaitense]